MNSLKITSQNNLYALILFILAAILSCLTYLSASLFFPIGPVVFIILFVIIKTENTVLLFMFLVSMIFFQNLYIGLISGLASTSSFKILHGFNFIVALLTFIFILFSRMNRRLRKDEFLLILILTILVPFTFIGLYLYGAISTLSYLRMFSFPIILFFVGNFFAEKKLKLEMFESFLFVFSLILIFSIYLQVLSPTLSDILFNDIGYFSKKMGSEIGFDTFLSKNSFYNISFLPHFIRSGGILKSVISSGYFLAITACYFISYNKRYLYSTFLLFTVIIFINSKGVSIMIFLFLVFLFLNKKIYWRSTRLSFFREFAGTAVFFIFLIVIIIGYRGSNEHIIGFFSGAKHIFSLGNGLGFSGNLSSTRLTSAFGSTLPDLGYWTRFQNGSESVFGVLFSSLGIFSFLFLYIFYKFFGYIKSYSKSFGFLSSFVIIVFVMGIFQEEAWSPYAFGFAMFILGFVQKNYELQTIKE